MSPYKDTEKRKQASRDSMTKKRGLTSGVNKVEGLTRLELIKQALGEDLVKDIDKLGGSEARYERAYRYHLWRQGKPLMIVHAIVEDRERLDNVYRSLRDARQEKNVYYGLPYNGLSFDIIGEMLEVTR